MQIFGSAPQEKTSGVAEVTLETFQKKVIEASQERPILVDFWAPWCTPCHQLMPLLEKVVFEEQEAFALVKINVDEEPEIAQQLRIQSLPTVLVFVDGQPVDGFFGLLSSQELKVFLTKLKGKIPLSSQDLIREGEAKLERNETTAALQIFTQILIQEPQNLKALAGMVKGHLQEGDLAKAKGYYALIGPEHQEQDDVKALKKGIKLAEEGQQAGDLSDLFKALERNPLDHDKRLILAKGLFAQGKQEQAVGELLTILSYDFHWQKQQAQQELLKFLEALGPSNPLAIKTRKQLSKLAFR